MQKTSNVKSRLTAFLKYLGIGQAKFAENVGLSRAFANNVGDSIRTDNLAKITAAYPELNTVWLLTGEGEMLKAPQNPFSQMPSQQIEEIAAKTFTERLMEAYRAGEIYPAEVHDRIVAEKDKRIEELQRENWELQKKIDDLSK